MFELFFDPLDCQLCTFKDFVPSFRTVGNISVGKRWPEILKEATEGSFIYELKSL